MWLGTVPTSAGLQVPHWYNSETSFGLSYRCDTGVISTLSCYNYSKIACVVMTYPCLCPCLNFLEFHHIKIIVFNVFIWPEQTLAQYVEFPIDLDNKVFFCLFIFPQTWFGLCFDKLVVFIYLSRFSLKFSGEWRLFNIRGERKEEKRI